MTDLVDDLIEKLERIQEVCYDACRAHWSRERLREYLTEIHAEAAHGLVEACDLRMLLDR